MKNKVIVKGIVMEEVKQEKNQSLYKIHTGEKEYAVISEGRQAIKDNIFISKGQHMIVAGKEEEGKIHSTQSKIILKRAEKISEDIEKKTDE